MIMHDKQDLTYLKWSHIRSSSGIAGSFLKSESILNSKKTYYKLSNYNSSMGVVGHECINEIIVARLLSILGVDHLEYDLIHADIEIENAIYTTYLCASTDFKQKGESKIALDDLYLSSCETNNLLDTSDSCTLLNCTRQNVSYLAKRSQLTPAKENVNGNLYLKGDVLRNMW